MIALILARGGSKGLPRKNILPFIGKPLIAHTIEAARKSRCITRMIVSTDDDEIASVAKSYGAEIPFIRPAHLSSDVASASDAMLHALDYLEAEGNSIQEFCLLQPTSPLRTADDIDEACKLFRERKADSVLSVTEYDHPVQWAVEVSSQGNIAFREKVAAMKGRQNLAPCFRPNGAIFFFNTDFFRRCPDDQVSAHSFAYVMPPERSVDIDTQLDFMIAETVAKYMQESGNA